jgi:hypothetical protein
MSELNHHGGCICGAVTYTTTCSPERITVCHCRWCQQRTGTAFGTEVVFLNENVDINGEMGAYRHVSDESGRWLEVHFCKRCGTNLGLTLELRPEIRSIPAGTFNGDPDWLDKASSTIRHVYTRSKRHWGDLSESTESFEGYFT